MKGLELFTWGGQDGPVMADRVSDPLMCAGGRAMFVAVGNFDGGFVKLQASVDHGATWSDVPDASFQARGAAAVQLPPCQLQTVVSGAASPVIEAMMFGPKFP